MLERYPRKGGWTYTVVPRNFKINRKGLWVQVKGTIDGHPVSGIKLAPLKECRMFFPVKADIRKVIGKEAGDHVQLVLYGDDPALEPIEELGSSEMIDSLKINDDAYQKFCLRKASEQVQMLDWVLSATTHDEKIVRINWLIDIILIGAPFR